MDDAAEILWRLYQEHSTHGRHHETLRATTTNILLVITFGILAILAHGDRQPTIRDLPLTLFILILGLVGALFTAKYYERSSMHMQRARAYRDALEQIIPAAKIKELNSAADAISKKKHPVLSKIKLYRFWVWLHLVIAIFGLLLTAQLLERCK